jgi:hypothetical protein
MTCSNDDVALAKEGIHLSDGSWTLGKRAYDWTLRSWQQYGITLDLQHSKSFELACNLGSKRISRDNHENSVAPDGHKRRQHRLRLASAGWHHNRGHLFAGRPMRVDGVQRPNLRTPQANHATRYVLFSELKRANPRVPSGSG